MKTIGIIGLGLIGGSLAKSIRKACPEARILAFSPHSKSSLAAALSEGVLDGILEARDIRFSECDYIFLCGPVEANLEYLAYFKDAIPASCILSDVGSVKGIIHEKVRELGLTSRFIGGHPMAGSERTGYENSSELLLENAYYILTPGEEIPITVLSDFTELVSGLGALPIVLTPEEHDYIVAGVSHLPHLIAASLVNTVKDLDRNDYMKTVAAGGFKDITRIASSSPVMWQQICLENSRNISYFLDEYIRRLIQIRIQVDQARSQEIYDLFAESGEYRDSIDDMGKGALENSYVLYCGLADEVGGIAQITSLLAFRNINIRDIGILHNREFVDGALKVSFYDRQAWEQAAELLESRNYSVFRR